MGRLVTVEELTHLPPGTVLSTITAGGIEHFGILTERQLFGQPVTVASASKRRLSVVEEWAMEFSLGAPVYTHGVWSKLSWQQTVGNARSQLGQPYRLFDRNCEHFVRFCHGLPQESPQLASAVGAVVVGGLILWATAA